MREVSVGEIKEEIISGVFPVCYRIKSDSFYSIYFHRVDISKRKRYIDKVVGKYCTLSNAMIQKMDGVHRLCKFRTYGTVDGLIEKLKRLSDFSDGDELYLYDSEEEFDRDVILHSV